MRLIFLFWFCVSLGSTSFCQPTHTNFKPFGWANGYDVASIISSHTRIEQLQVNDSAQSFTSTVSGTYSSKQLRKLSSSRSGNYKIGKALQRIDYSYENYTRHSISIGEIYNAIDVAPSNSLIRIMEEYRIFRRPRIITETITVNQGWERFVTSRNKDQEWRRFLGSMSSGYIRTIDSTSSMNLINSPQKLLFIDTRISARMLLRIKERLFSNTRFNTATLSAGGIGDLFLRTPANFTAKAAAHFSFGLAFDFKTIKYNFFGFGVRYHLPYEITTINSFKTFRSDTPGEVHKRYTVNAGELFVRYNFVNLVQFLSSTHSVPIDYYLKVAAFYSHVSLHDVKSGLPEYTNDLIRDQTAPENIWNLGGGVGMKLHFSKRFFGEIESSLTERKIQGENYEFTMFGDATRKEQNFYVLQLSVRASLNLRFN